MPDGQLEKLAAAFPSIDETNIQDSGKKKDSGKAHCL